MNNFFKSLASDTPLNAEDLIDLLEKEFLKKDVDMQNLSKFKIYKPYVKKF